MRGHHFNMAVVIAKNVLLVLVLFSATSSSLCTLVPRTAATDRPGTDSMNVTSTWPVSQPSRNHSSEEDVGIVDGLCRLTTRDPYVHKKVVHMLTEDAATLIEYQLNFTNYSENPLKINVAGTYDAKKWSRVTTAHGQTLLSLAFNYGVLSMKTLTLGTETMDVELQDSPPGCMATVSDRIKIDSVRHLLMRDFDADGPVTAVDESRVCRETIDDDDGYARFRHNCCYQNSITARIECTRNIGNVWLNLLYSMLTVVRFGLLCFGPSIFISAIDSMSKDYIPYVVRLTAKLEKMVCFCRTQEHLSESLQYERILDLTTMKAFPKLRNLVRSLDIPLGKPVKVRFPQYDICVDYRRTLKENSVPVGLFHALCSSIFNCHIRFVEPFNECCKANLLFSEKRMIPWITLFRKVAKILFILILPTPFYIRLFVFYRFESEALANRKRAIALAGLKEPFDNSLIHYFTPTHGLFVFIYVTYAVMALILAFVSRPHKEHRLQKIVVDSFRDLKCLSWTDTLTMFMSNAIWPFKKFGMLGCLVGLVYWPVAMPLTLIVSIAYSIPTIYLTIRMAVYSKVASVIKARRSHRRTYKVRVTNDLDIHRFETENVLNRDKELHASNFSLDEIDHVKPKEHDKQMDQVSRASTIIKYTSFSFVRAFKYLFFAVMCIVTLDAVVLVLSEVVGCLVEAVVFTTMGCIVNAGSILRYVMLILMVLVYCCDCFNNISKKYLKMNKALFNEVKGRIRDLEQVTSLPSSLQENCGFKAQELNEQASYEGADDVAKKPPNHWMINDLVLFVDSEDTPRIPKQLFDEVTQIRVAGVPGPVYRGYIEAYQQLLKIVLFIVFVFLIVLSFAAVYRISTTNQMLATLIGGFLPMILRTFLAPPAPDVELGTVSFKSKMDEVIKNFCQYWPIYDLPFELVPAVKNDKDGDNEKADDDNNNDAVADAGNSVDNNKSPSKSAAVVAEVTSYSNNRRGCYDGVCSEAVFVDEFSETNGNTASNSFPMTTYWKTPEAPESSSPVNKVVRIQEPTDPDHVDILICLPAIDLQWLEEWSDLDAGSVLDASFMRP